MVNEISTDSNLQNNLLFRKNQKKNSAENLLNSFFEFIKFVFF